MLRLNFSILLLALAFFGLSTSQLTPSAPYDPSPFTSIGAITSMVLDKTGGTLAGGSIAVDGVVIVIPANTLVTLPAITVAWGELFDSTGSPQALGFEANIIGNRVNNQLVAGLVYISQRSIQTTQGFISNIGSNGHFTVDGIDCVINDPVGAYGPVFAGDPLWTSDPQNPSIHAQNGFPMCIPRSSTDSLCPSKNRPKDANGNFKTIFTFGDPSKLATGDPDPNFMAPLVVGDYVVMQGTFKGSTYEVNALNANLGIFTAPGTKPAYVTVESAAFGITTPAAGEVAETRAVAWSTDVGSTLNWFAMDVDPCSGAVTERSIATGQPNGAGTVPVGRVTFRMGKTPVNPATRQVGFRLSTGTAPVSQNITAGQFVQPIFDYIFPELLTFGNPMLVNAFEAIPFLALGSGPYVPGRADISPPATPVIVGQLKPWPGAAAPAATSCPAVVASSSTVVPATSPTAPATTSSAAPVKDTVTITQTSSRAQKGVVLVSVQATTSDKTATLSMSLAGVNPVGSTVMNPVSGSPGSWTLDISVKNKPTTVTVTSTSGGSASKAL